MRFLYENDLNRYEFLVKRYGCEEDKETIAAISLEDAADQLNSDGYVEYWDYLPDFNYDIEASLKESLNLNEAENIINVLYKNLRVWFKHCVGGVFSLDRTPFNTDVFDKLIKNNYKSIGDILEENGLKYDISENAYISKDKNIYVTIYGNTSTIIVQFDEIESESLKESVNSATNTIRQIDIYYKDHPERLNDAEYLYSYKDFPIIKKGSGWYGYLHGQYSISRSTPEEVEQFIDKNEILLKKYTNSVDESSVGVNDLNKPLNRHQLLENAYIKQFSKYSDEYEKLDRVSTFLTAMSPNKHYYYVGNTYFDFGQDWKWTTILAKTPRGDSYQALNPRQQEDILLARSDEELEEIAKQILKNSYVDKGFIQYYFKNIKNESSSRSFKDNNLYEYFPVGRHLIDLDKVAFQVWDELLPDKLGEENWIEFEYDDPRDLLGSNEQTLNFLAIGNKRELKGYFTTKNTKISVKFKHGPEAICNNVEEIVRFIIGAVNN